MRLPKNRYSSGRSKTRRVITLTIAAILIAITAWIIYNHFKPAPVYPLGDSSKLEYVGNTGYGCWVVCDANPGEVYYYATDMSVEEVVRYFKGAKTTDELSNTLSSQTKTIGFDVPNTSGFYITYYEDGDKELSSYTLHTSKHHVISISAEQYKIALGSL